MYRRSLLALSAAAALSPRFAAADPFVPATEALASRDEPRALVVTRSSGEVFAQGFNGFTPDRRTNIKSASKSIISALVGIAIERGVLEGPDQPIAPLLKGDLPRDPDPRLAEITIGHLLSMRAGLERKSGANYGAWVSSRNWVRTALAAPFVDNPGGRMLYSTASTHLLSAILTGQTGRSTLSLAGDWLGAIDGFRIEGWDRDPQGIYVGGNQMAMSTRSLAAFGRLYLRRGVTPDGAEVIPQDWIAASWAPRTQSYWSGDGYGYGWFIRRIAKTIAFYGWGYGGQMIYILPTRDLAIAITSDPSRPSARTGYRDLLHGVAASIVDRIEETPAQKS